MLKFQTKINFTFELNFKPEKQFTYIQNFTIKKIQ